jgi:PAS domain S-box-containing protein
MITEPRVSTSSRRVVGAISDRPGSVARWRRRLTWALGGLWLLDAVLQAQPFMFTPAFAREELATSGSGSPIWVSAPVAFVAHLTASHSGPANIGFLLVQLAIGLGLLWRRTTRAALAVSIGWAVGVWWLGEGLGGIGSGAVSPLVGAPGAAVLYGFAALLLWPRDQGDPVSVAAGSVLGARVSRRVWCAMWIAFAVEMFSPTLRSPRSLHDLLSAVAVGEPGWIKHIDLSAASWLDGAGLYLALALSGCFVAVAVASLVPAWANRSVLAVIVLAAVFETAENVGGLATGRATDPNSGPPLVLLALCFWTHRPVERVHARALARNAAARVRSWLPRGGELPPDVWEKRHHRIVSWTYVAAVGCVLFGLIRGYSITFPLLLAALVAVPAIVAGLRIPGRTVRSTIASIGLLNACAVSIQLAGGATEAHFTFFVALGILTLYQDWVPFLVTIGYVVVHHGVMGTLMPKMVFDNPAAWNDPWLWASIHGAFILAASVAYVAAWRVNENFADVARASMARLGASEQRFRALVQRSSDVTLVCDRNGVLSYVSAASATVLGFDEDALMNRSILEVVHPDDRAVVGRSIAGVLGARPATLECRMTVAGTADRWVEMSVGDLCGDPAVGGVVLHVRDVTDRRQLERELRHAQKLESVGQLASGIAHEINTPIQFIGDNVRFLDDAFTDQQRVLSAYRDAAVAANLPLQDVRGIEDAVDFPFLEREIPLAIDQTLDGVERVAKIVRAMKTFGHPNGESKAVADLNQAIRDTLVVANHAVKHSAVVETDLGELPPVLCHIGDINQVVLNLVVNAAQAIAGSLDEGALGRIRVLTRLEGAEAVIEISDSGPGITPEVADRVFEPFYTTKEVGVGTGQGLSIAYTLIHDRHGGSIGFASTPGGTTFTVRLPVDGSAVS